MKEREYITVGFIGQGYVGKSYADDFESRGFSVIRYSQEEAYIGNKDAVGNADVVFIAVPTPTTAEGFDDSIIRSVVPLVGKGKIAVIKSTMLPGTTESIQDENPDIIVLNSPEFLSEKTAGKDASSPRRNIIGVSRDTDAHKAAARFVLDILPKAPYELICGSREAEFIKYANNTFFYSKIVFMNLLHDAVRAHGASWEHVRDAMSNEPWIGDMHIDPVHKTGRGAGGACFIKDFAAFRFLYTDINPDDELGLAVLHALEQKNLELLRSTNKDLHLIEGVYGVLE